MVIPESKRDMEHYYDFNATTPIAPSVRQIVAYTLESVWGNPSSSSATGRDAKKVLDTARRHVADMVGADPEDIIFTSGGTESNALVLHSVIQSKSRPHIITSNIEHPAIKAPLQHYIARGACRVDTLNVLPSGHVDPDDVVRLLRPDTVLVSVMLANNETGILNDIQRLVQIVREWEKDHGTKVFVHTDAAQAIGKVDVNVQTLGVDYLSIVGHKFYGPRNGALYARKPNVETPLVPMFYGGGQERGWRAGTENTAMIAGLGEACRLVSEYGKTYRATMQATRDAFEAKLVAQAPPGYGVYFTGFNRHHPQRLPNTSHLALIHYGSDGTPHGCLPASELVDRMMQLGVTIGKGAAYGHMHDRMLFLVTSMIGLTVEVATRQGAVYEWILHAASTDGELGVVLSMARQTKEGKEDEGKTLDRGVKKSFIIRGRDLAELTAKAVDFHALDKVSADRDTFKTDTDISYRGSEVRERELHRWNPSDHDSEAHGHEGGLLDGFQGGEHGWDQFAVNEKLFGLKTNFDEELYTTKLDRTGSDYKERERRAQELANEIQRSMATNVHLLEERGGQIDDSGMDEEDRYGAVVRNAKSEQFHENRYVPPALRKGQAKEASALPKEKVSEAPNDAHAQATKPATEAKTPASGKAAAIANLKASVPSLANLPTSRDKSGADQTKKPVPSTQENGQHIEAEIATTFRQFATTEKERLQQRRQAIQKKEKDGRLAELMKFHATFKLNSPVPDDLVPLLGKAKKAEEASSGATSNKPEASAQFKDATLVAKPAAEGKAKSIDVIETPKPPKQESPAQPADKATPSSSAASAPLVDATESTAAAAAPAASESKPTEAPAKKLNPKATEFKPNVNAPVFTPGAKPAAPATSKAPKSQTNTFFGDKQVKKGRFPSKHVLASPFEKDQAQQDPKSVTPTWPYGTKSYRHQYQVTNYEDDNNPMQANQAYQYAYSMGQFRYPQQFAPGMPPMPMQPVTSYPMAPGFMATIPFSSPMPPHTNGMSPVYSPQMPPPSPHTPFVSQAGFPSPQRTAMVAAGISPQMFPFQQGPHGQPMVMRYPPDMHNMPPNTNVMMQQRPPRPSSAASDRRYEYSAPKYADLLGSDLGSDGWFDRHEPTPVVERTHQQTSSAQGTEQIATPHESNERLQSVRLSEELAQLSANSPVKIAVTPIKARGPSNLVTSFGTPGWHERKMAASKSVNPDLKVKSRRLFEEKPRPTQPKTPVARGPTMPQPFNFTYRTRSREITQETKVLAPKDGGIKKSLPPSAMREPTKPIPFHFHTTTRNVMRHLIEQQKPNETYTPLAVELQKAQASFASRAPLRVERIPVPRKSVNGLTIPKSPNFHPRRSYAPAVKSTEETELEKMQKVGHFKAHPVNRKIFESAGDLGVPRVKKPPVTIPISPQFAKRPPTIQKQPSPPPQFHAKPPPKLSIFQPQIKHRKLKVPHIEFPSDSIARAKRQRLEHQIEKEEQEEKAKREFRATGVSHPRKLGINLGPPRRVKLTEPQPFTFRIDSRGERYQRQFQERLSQWRQREEAARIMRAKPVPKSIDKPFVPLKSDKPLTSSYDVHLLSADRAVHRQIFEEHLQQKEREMERLERLKRLREEASIRRCRAAQKEEQEKLSALRQTLVHHPQPLLKGHPIVIKPSTKPLTVPVSPKWHTMMRRGIIS
ncbi:hypothetical protein BZG36_03894 [Bifiguratus adelaidae]|uniref:Selenocysteine lyase n=1 Tax=Bifiguratus adelaidae TaxID=1938954 RepID=A0A261XY39_9FUNG|nr:hypothetical protein BZG36_03894 [Bifiguratus adelaidae]